MIRCSIIFINITAIITLVSNNYILYNFLNYKLKKILYYKLYSNYNHFFSKYNILVIKHSTYNEKKKLKYSQANVTCDIFFDLHWL